VAILSVVTAAELALLWWGRSFFAAPLPELAVPKGGWAEPVLLAGALMASYGFAFLAAAGFAPDGHFPALTAAIFAVGVLLVALSSQERVRVETISLRQ
jgi:ABC-type multidrug transport system permease subunit